MTRLEWTRIVLALAMSAPLSGQDAAAERGRLRGRVIRVDGTAWAGARVFFASTLFPNAIDASLQDTVEVKSDERGYFTALLLRDRSYATWAARGELPRKDGLRVYRVSHVAAAGVGCALRLIESKTRAVRVPCPLPENATAGSRWIARGLIHPPAQAEAISVVFELERDTDGTTWTPMWPTELVPLQLVSRDAAVLGSSRAQGNLGNALRQPRRNGKRDVSKLIQPLIRPPEQRAKKKIFTVSGRILRDGRPFKGIVVVRDVANGFGERLVRPDAKGIWRLAGVRVPMEIWCREASAGSPQLSFVGGSSILMRADFGTTELNKLISTDVQVRTIDGSRARRAVIAIETYHRSLGVLRSFADRRGRVRINRRKGTPLAIAARWDGGFATAKLPEKPSFDLVGGKPRTIEGRVVDGQDKAQAATLVSLHVQPTEVNDRLRFLLPTRSWTDAKGGFRLTLPVVGWVYSITASRFLPGGGIGSDRIILRGTESDEALEALELQIDR